MQQPYSCAEVDHQHQQLVSRFLSYRMIPQSDWPTLDDIRKPRSISLWGVWQVTDANLIESASDGLPLPVTVSLCSTTHRHRRNQDKAGPSTRMF
ncbi:hypothetical protein CBS147332_6693 [Penicillium roqueforti]|nr:hypothetical protein CBS147355_6143 [Penicillium roqueforti]KAI2707635.1 hypothetical protein CBS147332_6693 [Penicillium roqueforti]KAI3112225.1 hypothetical protein CBS147331_4779 [Penicillium roqueforti]